MGRVNWFPGHMAKARRVVTEYLKYVDVVLEVLDARAPYASRNPEIDGLLGSRPRLIILNKADLADPRLTEAWAKLLRSQGWSAGPVNSQNGEGVRAVVQAAHALAGPDLKRALATGGEGRRPWRRLSLMVVGIPNVGKSSLINRLGDRGRGSRNLTAVPERDDGGPKYGRPGRSYQQKLVRTGALPGVTRGHQWIQVGKYLRLLDLPGILWPRLEDPHVQETLAFVGAIREETYDAERLAGRLLAVMAEVRPGVLTDRYGLAAAPVAREETLTRLAEVKRCLLDNGRPDLYRAAVMVLTDFREGRLGRISLEDPAEYGRFFAPRAD